MAVHDDAAVRTIAVEELVADSQELFLRLPGERHARPHAALIAGPLSRRKLAIVLKSGAGAPSTTSARCCAALPAQGGGSTEAG
jgi:hypothetical protein